MQLYIYTYVKVPQIFMRMNSAAAWSAEYSRS